MELTRRRKSSIQPAVKIDGPLNDLLSEWLKTDYAKSLGFHSKASFITQAARELLLKYRGPHFIGVQKCKTHYTLDDNLTTQKVKIVINNTESSLECSSCDSFNCNHIFFIWSIPQEESDLTKMGFLNPLNYVLQSQP